MKAHYPTKRNSVKIGAKHHGIHEIPPFGRLDSCAKGFVEAFLQAKVYLKKVSNWFVLLFRICYNFQVS